MSDYVYAAHADINHREIIRAYQELHCSVLDLHKLGGGTSDILVGIAGQANELVEIKAGDEPLRPNQLTFNRDWRGRKPLVVRTVDDVIKHVRRIRGRE